MQLSPTEQMRQDQQRRESDSWEAKMVKRLGIVLSFFSVVAIILSGAWWFGAQASKEGTAPLELKIAKNETRIESVEKKQINDDARAVRMETKMDKIIDLIMGMKQGK